MKTIIPRLYCKVHSTALIWREHRLAIRELGRQRSKYILIFGSPIHGNLGDHAISCAERAYLKRLFPECGALEVSSASFLLSPADYQRVVRKDDIILITGGGFLGDLWENEDRFVKRVIQAFRENQIIVMPQTVYFCDKNKFLETRNFLTDYQNLFLFAREERSYRLFCRLYKKERVFLVPDIVLTLSEVPRSATARHGALLCMRQDKEKAIDDKLYNALCSKLREMGMQMRHVDTVEPGIISFRARTRHLDRLLVTFSETRLVITDRLHGMLFSVITHTPCIAIDNMSRKVKGVYQWVTALPYLRMIDSEEEIDDAMNVCDAPREPDAITLLKSAFAPLQAVIAYCIRKE